MTSIVTSQGPLPPSDTFGCQLNKLTINQELSSSRMSIFRKASANGGLGQVRMGGKDDGLLVGLSLTDGHVRRIASERHTSSHHFNKGSIYIREQTEDYKADVEGAFDFLLFDLPSETVTQFAADLGLPSVRNLIPITAEQDSVLANLARAVLPALENPSMANPFFVEQITAAIATHLVQCHAGQPIRDSTGKKKLSRSQERLAKEMIAANLSGQLTVTDIAAACDISRGHFIRMFRETTGMTPHRWLVEARLKKATELLRNSEANLSEIAQICGFADQSHFTRVFAASMGVAPGAWRRNQ